MNALPKFVTIPKCAELLGLTQEAIRQLKRKGQWREKVHWIKAPNGRIFICIPAVELWLQGKLA